MAKARALLLLAWLNALLHVLGLLLAVVGMRPGTPAIALEQRMAYLASRPAGWVAGWSVWALCALVLVGFFGALLACAREGEAGPLRSLALALGAAGAAVDLSCDTLWIVVVPDLAASGQTALFVTLERALGAAGLVVANGLYSIAVLIAALSLREGRLLGYATYVFGMLMVAAGFTGDPRHLEWTTGPTIVAFVGWTLMVARAEQTRV